MEFAKRHWITGLAIAVGVFLLFLAVAIAVDDEPGVSGPERAFGVATTGAFGLALLGGLWSLRTGRFPPPVCLGVIALGLVGGLVWFWMLIPPVAALVVFWFGVVKGGLTRELTTA